MFSEFATTLEKVAVGSPIQAPPGAADLYAQQMAKKEVDDLFKSTSPQAKAKALSLGFTTGLAIPVGIGFTDFMSNLPGEIARVNAAHRQTYLAEYIASIQPNLPESMHRRMAAALDSGFNSSLSATEKDILSGVFNKGVGADRSTMNATTAASFDARKGVWDRNLSKAPYSNLIDSAKAGKPVKHPVYGELNESLVRHMASKDTLSSDAYLSKKLKFKPRSPRPASPLFGRAGAPTLEEVNWMRGQGKTLFSNKHGRLLSQQRGVTKALGRRLLSSAAAAVPLGILGAGSAYLGMKARDKRKADLLKALKGKRA